MRLEFSAGGVVFKKSDGDLQILVAQHSGHHGWVFPKGLIGDHKKGETKEETAVREVEEETGIKARILKPLTPITYWYVWEGEKRKKTVYYFLMEFVEDTGKRDDEMEAVEWILASQVEQKLTYPADKKVWKEAQDLIK
ncbi:MAG TPA: NUDIX hydrolase [Patescibacteria group bacterium]|nr:NUDIX hydrolase [Patescibacteria group bacterium]